LRELTYSPDKRNTETKNMKTIEESVVTAMDGSDKELSLIYHIYFKTFGKLALTRMLLST